MANLNTILLVASLLLELALLALMWRRSLLGEFPVFTALVAFYLVRAIVLYAIFSHIPHDAFSVTYNILGVVDLGLQTWLAFEFYRLAGRGLGSSRAAERTAAFLSLAVVAGLTSWALSSVIPANPRSPLDRGIVFTGLLLVGIGVLSRWSALGSFAARLLAGFTVLGGIAIAAQVGRTLAAAHRNAPAYRLWAYVEPTAYLVVLAFWVVTLGATGKKAARPAAKRIPIAQVVG